MNTQTPAQALGEVLKLCATFETHRQAHDYTVACRFLEEVNFQAGLLVRQHGQYFAGLEAALAKSNQSRAEYAGEVGVLQVELLEMKARAEAAEDRVREAEGLLRECVSDDGALEFHGTDLTDHIAAFLAARG